MMLQPFDVELEDGELSVSSDDVYTPLQRPMAHTVNTLGSAPTVAKSCSPLATCHQMQSALEEDNDSQADSSDSSESSDACLRRSSGECDKIQRKQKKRIRRTVMVRVQPTNVTDLVPEKRSRFKKYNIWTEALQEDALTENMRGCDVTQSGCKDRNVENYDFSLRYRLNGENSLKRRLSNSIDEVSEGELHPQSKRGRRDPTEAHQSTSIKSRLGHRHARRGSSATSGSNNSYEPHVMSDLEETADRDIFDVAREMATKLAEQQDELLIRIVEVLGIELPMEIFKETQRIEAKGGMMTKNGVRRRTPGGVFFFLLKNHERLTEQQRNSIFNDKQVNFKERVNKHKSKSRDRKVEELKKRLSEQEKELPALSTRKDHYLLGSDLCAENQPGNLSNPPPSPVGHEQSPEYKTHAINHVAPIAACSEKPSTSGTALASSGSAFKNIVDYDDDFLDVDCGDMDFF